jgi:hypothetical protein
MDEPLIEVARAIRPFLPQLLPPLQAEEVDREIAELLNAPGGDLAPALQTLLEQHEATADFMADVLDDAPLFRPPAYQHHTVRSSIYKSLPGDPPPAYAGKFGCPQGDFVWYRPAVGMPVPCCPTHNVTLVRLP